MNTNTKAIGLGIGAVLLIAAGSMIPNSINVVDSKGEVYTKESAKELKITEEVTAEQVTTLKELKQELTGLQIQLAAKQAQCNKENDYVQSQIDLYQKRVDEAEKLGITE